MKILKYLNRFKVVFFFVVFLIIAIIPISKVSASFSLLGGISTACRSDGNCSVCDMLSVLYQVAKFVFVSMSGIALIMLLWGATGFIMNWGSAEKIAEAKKTILNTVLAVVIILLSWTLTNAIITILAGKGTANVVNIIGSAEGWWVGPSCSAPVPR